MTKTLGVSSAVALLLALSLPGPTNALETKQREGLTKATPQATEISAQRRRVVRRYYRYPRRYYRPYYAYRPYPYYYRPYPYYRPYYGPGVYFGAPGFAFRFGW